MTTHTMTLSHFKQLRRQIQWWREINKLRRGASRLLQSKAAARRVPVKRLLILPSDPWTLVGAKGDEAMMQAVVGQLRQQNPELTVGVIIATEAAEQAARLLRFTPISAWDRPLDDAAEQIKAFGPDAMVVLGADVMDGYYNPVTTTRMLLTADAAARQGVRVAILGFSFNLQPNRLIRPVFEGLSDKLSINVRDRISHQRFTSFCRAPAKLVADAAFMLQPDPTTLQVKAMEQWAGERRSAGDVVIGFNMHPMLVRDATEAQVKALVDSAVGALRAITRERKLSVLLMSHDYRGQDGDDVCLAPIYKALAGELGSRLMYLTTQFSAAELKAMAGLMDGVVTGRMHLAIASLGMGKPVAALTYQDKFQGLFAHFDYPEKFLLAPADAAAPQKLQAMVTQFLDDLPALTARVKDHLPKVKEASMRNLERITA
jgi:colanic acid/amylovoran biosynthesis protein